MKTVGIKTLKNKLSEYVRAAAAGETVQVTDRGKVVAELVPPRAAADAPGATEAERQWAELIRLGHVTPAKVPPEERVPPRSLNIMTLEELMAELDVDRADR
jgi:prevent-host-death family protein